MYMAEGKEIRPAKRGLTGKIRVPGDKSVSHRSVMFSAIAKGQVRVRNFLEAADCLSTAACMRALGAGVVSGTVREVAPMAGGRLLPRHGRRPAWLERAAGRPRCGKFRHDAASSAGDSCGAAVLLGAYGRRIALASPHGACRRTAHTHGGCDSGARFGSVPAARRTAA